MTEENVDEMYLEAKCFFNQGKVLKTLRKIFCHKILFWDVQMLNVPTQDGSKKFTFLRLLWLFLAQWKERIPQFFFPPKFSYIFEIFSALFCVMVAHKVIIPRIHSIIIEYTQHRKLGESNEPCQNNGTHQHHYYYTKYLLSFMPDRRKLCNWKNKWNKVYDTNNRRKGKIIREIQRKSKYKWEKKRTAKAAFSSKKQK